MAGKTDPIPGTSDIFPAECRRWQKLESAARATFRNYGYGEIRPPIMERTDTFLRSIGDDTDIVQKEMYTFEDRGGRSLTLRPEGTAGVIRALVNAGVPQGDEKRVYYLGPMFRGERPAAGRRRQFHQVGAECVGKVGPEIDAESIALLLDLLQAINVERTTLLLNSRGTAEDRRNIASVYVDYFTKNIDSLCDDCRRRLATNVWRILDCKNEGCRDTVTGCPAIVDLLSEASRVYFKDVCSALDHLKIPYKIDPLLIRGLDYYAHTVFEVTHDGLGAQDSVAGGGRYELTLPGMKNCIHGVGFAAGIERLLMVQGSGSESDTEAAAANLYLVSMGKEALHANLKLASVLRRRDIAVLMDLECRGMKAQMRAANKSGAAFTVIRGEDELDRDMLVCKNMTSSDQTEIPMANAVEQLTLLVRGK